MSVVKSKRNKSPYETVETAAKLFTKVTDMCLKMPKRYTYLLLKDTVELAGRVQDFAIMANSVFPTNQHEAQMRTDYWIRARSHLQALSGRMNRFVHAPGALTYREDQSGKTKGVTRNEILEICDLINQEQALLTGTLKSERERYKSLPNTDPVVRSEEKEIQGSTAEPC